MLIKRFQEDDKEASMGLSKHQKEIRAQMLTKFSALYTKQQDEENVKSTLEGGSKLEESKVELLSDVIANLKEEYFSDLCPGDIPDDEVSDVDESEIDVDQIQKQLQTATLNAQIKAQEEIIDKYSQENLEFMTKLIQMFATDPVQAKAFYYMSKLKQDVTTPEGTVFKRKMLMKYLEGLQWVLYYYYRGAQHWRWYYPYHYAPMISDIDENIVEFFLKGKVTIDSFEIDHNCADINIPYTPFQQLLSIMPLKSIGLLPPGYGGIARSEELRAYFPQDFDIDLNGRALPWEAATLIPFVDEKLFIENEAKMIHAGPEFSNEDKRRNQIYFYFKKYRYDAGLKKAATGVPLVSTIKKFANLPKNLATLQLTYDYQDVGKHSFLPRLLPGVVQPCPDFPSIKWIGANAIDYDVKVVNRVEFKRVLIRIPSCMEDKSNEKLEDFVNKLAKNPVKEMYIGLPYQIEAFPTVFQDDANTFTLYGDVYTNVFHVHKDFQQLETNQWKGFVARQRFRLQDEGFKVDDDTQAFVSVNRVSKVLYDNKAHLHYKVYDEESILLPLSLVMRRRDPNHYLNVNQRCHSLLQSFQPASNVLCLNTQLFGVVGTLHAVNSSKGTVKVAFDKESEEQKIHDPFLGLTVLKDYQQSQVGSGGKSRYYSDSQIEEILKLPRGCVNKITGNFLVTFNDRDRYEKNVIDLGLNIKNFTKKQHIPDYVRFVADPDQIADNQYDGYYHNQHSRGARHVRKHWEYSEECFAVIKDYREKFPEVFDGLYKSMKGKNPMINSLKDLFGKAFDEFKVIMRFKEAVAWIEKIPFSHLPFVEMGFDALHSDLIRKLQGHKDTIKEKFQTIQLQCNEFEHLPPDFVYQESFPFWSQPYSAKVPEDYKVGDRVININSTKREYVPFGLRGTVVGHTNDRVIVLFDEQYLAGNNIMGHCEDYRGGNLNPNHLINLTHKFSSLVKKNLATVIQFIEQPEAASGSEQEVQQITQARAELQTLLSKEKSTPPQQMQSSQQQQYQQRGEQGPRRGGNRPQQQRAPAFQQVASEGANQYRKKEHQPPQLPPTKLEESKSQQVPSTSQKPVYMAKQQQAVVDIKAQAILVTQNQTVAKQDVFGDDEEDKEEEYQDLNTLKTQLQSTKSTPVPVISTNFDVNTPAFTPTLKPAASVPQPQQAADASQSSSGFVPSVSLQENPAFMQLMEMMNNMAAKLQVPVFPAPMTATPPKEQEQEDAKLE